MFGLVIPPVSDCFMPTLGAAQIIGFLKKNLIPCKMYDLSGQLNQSVLQGNSPIPDVYKEIMDKQPNSFRKLVSYYNILSLISDCKITTDDFNCGVDWKNTLELEKYINDKSTLMYDLFNRISSINELSSYKFIGFSVSYSSQVIPSLILANIIKSKKTNTKIILGGSFFYNYCQEFFNVFFHLDIIDYVIVGCGESVIKDLILFGDEYIESSCDYETTNINGRLYINTYNEKKKPVVYDPYFEDIDFNIYPCPEKAFPYMIRSSCYYGKCKFCNGDKLACNDIRKDIYKSFENINLISNRIGINNVYIVDAALSPIDFIKIAEMTLSPNVNWIANARFDKPLANKNLMNRLSKNGCKMLRFGLESGSQYVLDLMNKGTILEIAEKILRYSSEAGIQNHLYIMLGYPGETNLHRRETLDFLQKNRKYITSYSISFFQPIPNTPIYNELKMLISSANGDEYSEMINYVYKDSEYYQQIVDCAEKIKTILNGYSQTNSEYYSANIFSEYSVENNAIIMHKELIFDNEIDLNFENELEIIIHDSNLVETYWICDFYSNLKIKITSPIWVKDVLTTKSFTSQEDMAEVLTKKYGFDSWKIIKNLLYVLNDVSSYIDNYQKDFNILLCEMIELNIIKGNKLRNMSIQFSPNSMIVEE